MIRNKVPSFIGPGVVVMLIFASIGGLVGAAGVPWYWSGLLVVPIAFYVTLFAIEIFWRYVAVPAVNRLVGGQYP